MFDAAITTQVKASEIPSRFSMKYDHTISELVTEYSALWKVDRTWRVCWNNFKFVAVVQVIQRSVSCLGTKRLKL